MFAQSTKIVSEYDQEIPKSQTTDNPMAPRGQNFFESICGKMFSWKVVYGWRNGYNYKKREKILFTYEVQCINTKKPYWFGAIVTTISSIIHTSLVQVQQTAQMFGYCYNKYECWSGASVSDTHACRSKLNRHDC